MKRDFGIKEAEGRRCFEVLQRGMTQRCCFCKRDKLLKMWEAGEEAGITWIEENTLDGRSYKNHDRLIPSQGRLYHVQYSTDMTELMRLSKTQPWMNYEGSEPKSGKRAAGPDAGAIQEGREAPLRCPA